MRFVGTALIAGTIGVFFLLADGGLMRAGTGTDPVKPPPARSRKNREFVELEHFKRIVGTAVQNVDGEEIGVIKDFILQRPAGEPQYVIVRSRGFIGPRRLVLVPVFAIAMTTAKVGIASVDISTRQWKRAPEFRKEDLALLAQPPRAQSIARFYGRTGGSSRLSWTGRESREAAEQKENGELRLASDVVGKDIVSREQKEIGRVTDLLLDFSQKKTALALVSAPRTPDRFAVPVRLLNPTQDGRLRLDADRESFEHAQPFSLDAWESSRKDDQNLIYRWERR